MNIPETKLPRIVIVGGGFAGVSLVKKLKGQNVQLVLIDKSNYHTFQPLLYQVSSSGLEPDSIAYPLRKIIKKHRNTYFRMAEVLSIEAKTKKIETSIGSLNFDFLVLATGTVTNFFGNKEMAKNSMPMKSVPQALDIRSLILQNFEKATITDDPKRRKALLNFVIVGAGPTGVELAGAIAELKNNILPIDYHDLKKDDMQIHLLEGANRVLPPMSDHASKKAEQFLKDLGVKISCNVVVEHYDGFLATTNTDQTLETETLIWAAGVTGAPVKGLNDQVLIDKLNRYRVNRFNQVVGHDKIFAIGDIAYMETEAFPKGHPQVAQPAIQQGHLLAMNLKRLINGKVMQPFRYKDKGSMATIGRNRAVVDLSHYKFSGFFAWFIWMFVHLMSLVGFRNRMVVFFNWTYNYINFDKAARLIIRPFSKPH